MTESAPVVQGIVVEALSLVSASAYHTDGVFQCQTRCASQRGRPPQVLVPRFPGEPPRVDATAPGHPRGSGGPWPPEAACDDDNGSPRLSIAAAWRLLTESGGASARWQHCDGGIGELTPAEAIAAAAAIFAPRDADGSPSVLVIPNRLRMDRQQALIDASRERHRNLSLLWRPIAAALAWCNHLQAGRLAPLPQGTNGNPRLLSIHLGVDDFEITPIELVQAPANEPNRFLPARRRPTHDGYLKSFGLDVFSILLGSARGRDPLHSPKIAGVVDDLTAGRSTLRGAFSKSAGMLPGTKNLPKDLMPLRKWIEDNRPVAATAAGVVITGELAQFWYDERRRFAEVMLQQLHPSVDRSLVLINVDCEASLLACGAAIHAEISNENRTSYLDTLPRVQTAVTSLGQLGWLDLLNSDDTYVSGGQTWRRPQPLRGLKVQQGRQRLEVTLSHEEFPTVRKIAAEFPQPVAEDVPVRLEVSIQSAQGNAQVEVVPEGAGSVVRRLRLDWRHMKDEQLSPEKWLLSQPALFPPLLRRAAHAGRWNSAKASILTAQRSDVIRSLNTVTSVLQFRDPEVLLDPRFERRMTAVSSDGEVPDDDRSILDGYVRELVARLKKRDCEVANEIMRALAYTSTDNKDFQKYLAKRVQRGGDKLSADELKACGGCLRDPVAIHRFADSFDRRLNEADALNNWLKAFAEVLRFRETATREIPSATCESISRKCFGVFEKQLAKRTAQYLFRNSSLCIVYLLRRRAYDDDYLAPESHLNQQIRSGFVQAMEDFRKRRLRVIGGAFQLDRVLQTMIDFIDRKGTPSLTNDGGLGSMTE